MNNNDLLVGIRDALDIKITDMVEVFKLGGIELSKEDVLAFLQEPSTREKNEGKKCDPITLESFFNGFIVYKRGKKELKPGETAPEVVYILNGRNINNILLKKIKIALDLSSEDMQDVFEASGHPIAKGDLSDMFRKEGHKHYKRCVDQTAQQFLAGLAVVYRD